MPRILAPLTLSPPRPPDPRLPTHVLDLSGESMGTGWSVRAWAGLDLPAGRVRTAVQTCLDAVVAEMSPWEPTSHLSRFNRASAESWHVLPTDFFTVLCCGLNLAAQSGGAFDPACGALVDAWGFGPGGRRSEPPTPAALQAARTRPGWRHVRLDPANRRAWQPGGVYLDLCGIAKGFAVDAVAERLNALGIGNYLVEVGGELRGHGTKPDGLPWWVGIACPPGATFEGPPLLVALHGLSIATSGDYVRFFEHEGQRFAHTLDPRTGAPVIGALTAVTVLHASCMHADALATALTVLGLDAGMRFAAEHDIAALFWVHNPGATLHEHLSPAMMGMLA
jgi:FAD:protein FMN transferase